MATNNIYGLARRRRHRLFAASRVHSPRFPLARGAIGPRAIFAADERSRVVFFSVETRSRVAAVRLRKIAKKAQRSSRRYSVKDRRTEPLDNLRLFLTCQRSPTIGWRSSSLFVSLSVPLFPPPFWFFDGKSLRDGSAKWRALREDRYSRDRENPVATENTFRDASGPDSIARVTGGLVSRLPRRLSGKKGFRDYAGATESIVSERSDCTSVSLSPFKKVSKRFTLPRTRLRGGRESTTRRRAH